MRSCIFVLVLACTSAPEDKPLPCATPDDLAAPADVTLSAQEAALEPRAGVHFIAWTYGGDVPGPVLRLPLGAERRVKLLNPSPRPVSLHFHGVGYQAADDGSPEHPESVVNPGCAHVYSITAGQPGVWPFHSHVDARNEMSRGLYGAVIVPTPGEMPAQHELVVFLGQLGLEAPAAGGAEEGGAGAPGFFMTINGRPDGKAEVIELVGSSYQVRTDLTEATARVGDRVRFRVLNVSPDDPHTFHLHGHRFCDRGGVMAPSGTCPAGTLPTDNVALAPAQGTTLEFVEDQPGEWMYHCHILDHVGDGMYAFYRVLAQTP